MSRMGCPRVESNHHALSSTGPQPAAYTIPPRGQVITDYGCHSNLIFVTCQSPFLPDLSSFQTCSNLFWLATSSFDFVAHFCELGLHFVAVITLDFNIPILDRTAGAT